MGNIRYDYRAAPWGLHNASNTDLYELPSEYRPTILWALEQQKDRNDWASTAAHIAGHQAMCAAQWELIMGASTERIIGATDRIYALLDSTFNAVPRSGTFNSATGVTTFVPPIPAGPGLIAIKALEVRHNEAYAEQLGQGVTLDTVALELAEIKALLAAIDAEQTAEDLTEIITRLGAILALL